MKTCANCGAELEPGTKFCSQCGKPVPQMKVCPDCRSEQKPEAKFCSNCGHRFGAPVAADGAADMGLKIGHSTVMGDISNAVNYVTNVTNADETRHVVKCHVCGKVLTVVETHECPRCHENVCDEHFDLARKMCTVCVELMQKEGEAAFRHAIREELTAGGGRLTQEALGRLRQRRIALGLEEARGRELIVAERRAEAPADGTVLTDVQRRFLEKAKRLIFNDGKCAEGVAEIDQILAGGVVQSDEILAVLLPALLGCDEKRGDSIAQSVLADSLPVALYRVDRALRHADWAEADRKLVVAEQVWPDDVQVRCRRVALLCAMGRELGDDDLYEQARTALSEVPATDDLLERSWLSCVAGLIPGETSDVSADDGLYAAILSGALTGLHVRQSWWSDETSARVRELWRCLKWLKRDEALRTKCMDLMLKEDRNHPEVQYHLGVLFDRGWMGQEVISQARPWFETAACAGHYLAAMELGRKHADGAEGYEKNEARSRQWFEEAHVQAERAAKAGDARAMFDLGRMYRWGINYESKADPTRGVFWWTQAAEHGNLDAQLWLARDYENGEVVPPDPQKRFDLFLAAAKGGYMQACQRVADCYASGIPGVVTKDEAEEKKWRSRAEEIDRNHMISAKEFVENL